MLEHLRQWARDIPLSSDGFSYIDVVCELRYQCIKMLLLRPSPAIPKPSKDDVMGCYASACRTIRLYNQLYRRDMLLHDWTTLHGIVLGTITTLYCIRTLPELAQRTTADELMGDLSTSASILSAIGEHWSGAKRSRVILDDLGRSTIQWIKRLKATNAQDSDPMESSIPNDRNVNPQFPPATPNTNSLMTDSTINDDFTPNVASTMSTFPDLQPRPHLDGMLFDPIDQYMNSDTVNVDDIMQSLFNDFIPQMNAFAPAPGFYTG